MSFEIGYTFETETLAISKNKKSPIVLGRGGFGLVYQVKHAKNNDE